MLRTANNALGRLRAGSSRAPRSMRRRAPLSATVHYGAIWFNGQLGSGPNVSPKQLKRLAAALLDAGIEVKGYWKDCDYSNIDPRIGMGKVRAR
jgi:hypothetical protein